MFGPVRHVVFIQTCSVHRRFPGTLIVGYVERSMICSPKSLLELDHRDLQHYPCICTNTLESEDLAFGTTPRARIQNFYVQPQPILFQRLEVHCTGV